MYTSTKRASGNRVHGGNGSDVNAEDSYKTTPLHYAAKSGHDACVRALAAAGANKEARDAIDNSPLLCAACEGRAAGVRAMLAVGADKDARDGSGMTGLHMAILLLRGATDCVRALLAAGISIEVKERERQFTALHLAAFLGRDACVKALLDAGADKRAKATMDLTPLRLAHGEGHSSCVELLLAAGAVDDREPIAVRPASARRAASAHGSGGASGSGASGASGASKLTVWPCARCGTTEVPTKKCAGCLVVSYCSRECQKADWKDLERGHKELCKQQQQQASQQASQ